MLPSNTESTCDLHESRAMCTRHPSMENHSWKMLVLSKSRNLLASLLSSATQTQLLASKVTPPKSHLWNSLLWSQFSLLLLGWHFFFFILIFQKQLLTLCYLPRPDKDVVSSVCSSLHQPELCMSTVCSRSALLSNCTFSKVRIALLTPLLFSPFLLLSQPFQYPFGLFSFLSITVPPTNMAYSCDLFL